MSDPVEAVEGLLADIGRVAAAFDASRDRQDDRVRAANQECEAVRKAERSARARADRAEQAAAILREEREVIRGALREVARTKAAPPKPGGGSS